MTVTITTMWRLAKFATLGIALGALLCTGVWLWPNPEPQYLPGVPTEALVPGDVPHYVTPGGIPVYIVGTPPVPNYPAIGAYLDTAEAALRAVAIQSPLARVFIWAPHTIQVDRDGDGLVDPVDPIEGIILGATKFLQPDAGMSVVWLDEPMPQYAPEGNRIGAVAYAHERMHHAGWGERAIGQSLIDDFAAQLAEEALLDALGR